MTRREFPATVAALGALANGAQAQPTQAKLPRGMADEDVSIAVMGVGHTGWTVPWAMYADANRGLWLNGNYTIHKGPMGTVSMRVWRDEEGWHVDASRCGHDRHWSTNPAYVGGSLPIRVATFTPPTPR